MMASPVAPTTADPTEVTNMDALLVFSSIIIGLVLLAMLSDAFGVDSRDGFADEPPARA